MAIPLQSGPVTTTPRRRNAWVDPDSDEDDDHDGGDSIYMELDAVDKLLPFLETFSIELKRIAEHRRLTSNYHTEMFEAMINSSVTKYLVTLTVTWLSFLCAFSVMAMCKYILT